MSSVVPFLVMGLVTVVLGFAVTQMAMFATTVYLHRYLAHGGIELRPEVRAASRMIIWVTTAMKPRQWAQGASLPPCGGRHAR